MIRKKTITLLFISAITFTNLYSKNKKDECDKIFYRYRIDKNTKSFIGWSRVCKYNLLSLYANKRLNKKESSIVCKCFKPEHIGRDIENFKGGSK